MRDERTILRQEQPDPDGVLAKLDQKSSVKVRIDLWRLSLLVGLSIHMFYLRCYSVRLVDTSSLHLSSCCRQHHL